MQRPTPLEFDLPCIKCGYNLRMQASTGVCPECATLVSKSLEYSPTTWSRERRDAVALSLQRLWLANIILLIGFAGAPLVAVATPMGKFSNIGSVLLFLCFALMHIRAARSLPFVRGEHFHFAFWPLAVFAAFIPGIFAVIDVSLWFEPTRDFDWSWLSGYAFLLGSVYGPYYLMLGSQIAVLKRSLIGSRRSAGSASWWALAVNMTLTGLFPILAFLLFVCAAAVVGPSPSLDSIVGFVWILFYVTAGTAALFIVPAAFAALRLRSELMRLPITASDPLPQRIL